MFPPWFGCYGLGLPWVKVAAFPRAFLIDCETLLHGCHGKPGGDFGKLLFQSGSVQAGAVNGGMPDLVLSSGHRFGGAHGGLDLVSDPSISAVISSFIRFNSWYWVQRVIYSALLIWVTSI